MLSIIATFAWLSKDIRTRCDLIAVDQVQEKFPNESHKFFKGREYFHFSLDISFRKLYNRKFAVYNQYF